MQLLERLRSETQPSHQRLHDLIDSDRLTRGRDEYVDGLKRYLRVIAPAEQSVNCLAQSFLAADQLPAFWATRLQKASWLRADLARLNASPQSADGFVQNPNHEYGEAAGAAEALALVAGRCYALEGMTLGATRMASLVRDRLGLEPANGCRFFVGYGEETGAYWKAYRSWAESLQIDDAVAVSGAHEVFRAFESSFSGFSAALESARTDV